MHHRISEIKDKIYEVKPLTQKDLADAIIIALSFDNMITDICSALKKESEANE